MDSVCEHMMLETESLLSILNGETDLVGVDDGFSCAKERLS